MTGESPTPFFVLGIVIDCNGNICNDLLEFAVTTHIAAAGGHPKHVTDVVGNGNHRQVRLRDLIQYAEAEVTADDLHNKVTAINSHILRRPLENVIVLREAIAITGSCFTGTLKVDFAHSPLMNPAIFSQFLVLIFSSPGLPVKVNRVPYVYEAKRIALATFDSYTPTPSFRKILVSSR